MARPVLLDDAATQAAVALIRTRWLVRAPIWLFRCRLGAVFGGRLLLLAHIGRASGRRRYAVLEVVDHPTPDRWVVASAFGERAHWYRNVTRDPRVVVFAGNHTPVKAVAARLDADQADATLRGYAERHPAAWAQLRPVLEQTLGAPVDTAGATLPLVALDRVGAW